MALTILVCREGSAAKAPDLPDDRVYVGKQFEHRSRNPQSASELFELVRRLSGIPSAFVIRGRVRDDAPPVILRRYLGDDAHIEPAAQQWLCLDLDRAEIVTTEYSVETHPEHAAAIIRTRLPDGLRNARCLFQFSASARGHTARCHVWFWLDRPMSDSAVKKALTIDCDKALYNPVQPHFTAHPIYELSTDPLIRRFVEFTGGEASLTPKVDGSLRERRAAGLLDTACRQIKGIQVGDARHPVINRLAYRIGRYIPGGFVDEHEANTRLYSAAISGANPLPGHRAADEIRRALADGKAHPVPDRAWDESIDRTEKGAVKPTASNVALILMSDPDYAGCLAFDSFRQQALFVRSPPSAGDFTPFDRGPLSDSHIVPTQAWLRERWQVSPPEAIVWSAMHAAAREASVHPVHDYLDSITWDGKPRLSSWLSRYLGAAPSQYHSDVGEAWLTSLIARVRQPGCQADYCLVLEGPQGIGKSTALGILGGEFYTSIVYDVKNRDAWMALRGSWIVEFEELQALRAGEEQAIKAFITRKSDRYREPYGRAMVEYQRQCVFAASTNQSNYIHDPTGGRRWWPVECGEIDNAALSRDRDQLLAEASARYVSGKPWYLVDETGAKAVQGARMSEDPWLAESVAFLRGRPDGATAAEILTEALYIPPAQQSRYYAQRLSETLRAAGVPQASGPKGQIFLPPKNSS